MSSDAVLVGALVIYAGIYLSWLMIGWGGPDLQPALASGISIPLNALITIIAVRAALVARGRIRRAWAIMACALGISALGGIAWFIIEVVQGAEVPYPSIADLGYLGFYPLMVAGLLTLPRLTPPSRSKAGLDIGIVLLGSSATLWWLVIGPTVATLDSDPITSLVTMAYPVGDLLVLFVLAAAFMGRIQNGSRSALALLGIGMLFYVVADLAWARLALEGSYESGAWLDALYVFGSLCVGLAGLAQVRALRGDPASPSLTVTRALPGLPYVAVASVYGLLALSSLDAVTDEQALVAGAIGVTLLVVVRQAITSRENARLLAEQASSRSTARFRAIIQGGSDVIAVVDRDAAISWVSPSIATLDDGDVDTMPGRSLATIVSADDAPLLLELLRRATDHPGTTSPITIRSRSLPERRLDVTVTNLLSEPLVGGLVVTFRDVSERHAYEEQLRSQALHDALTGLANRVLFADRVEQALTRGLRRQVHPAVLYLDLDDFKGVNDALGHEAGDEVLIQVAQRLRATLREEDTAARLGGDEFAVLLEDTREAWDPVVVAERLREALQAPFTVAGRPLQVTASIGIVRGQGRLDGAPALLRDADIAMYEAKGNARGSYRIFRTEMYTATVERVRLESDLRVALDEGQLDVVYQPLIRLEDGVQVGVEALLRWHHPARGMVMPADFIPLAESSGEIRRIGLWVIERACTDVLAAHAGADAPSMRASVNVSVRQLEPGFVDAVAAILTRTGFPPRQLVLEITESVFASERPSVVAVLEGLRSLGVRIAIDDFGTGYSALSYLRDLPVDELKIDRAFISRVANGPDRGLVTTILQLGRDLQLETVAEGIEMEEQADLLRAMGCELGQGYHLGRPMPIGAMVQQARTRTPVAQAAGLGERA